MADPDILIETDALTRRFRKCEALGSVSFRVRRGQVAALLGPNGSGKTTTLRILAAALAPSSGFARIAGLDVETHSLDVRRRIGYAPESTPLYPEMRVAEYLEFRGRIKGLRGQLLASRLRSALDRCGLADVAGRLVGPLSLGYRRRVGLADCFLAEPDVLLLDEPTAGLDPAQAAAVRSLLRDFGRCGAVLFSTHDLAEAANLCDIAVVLNAGRLAAAAPPAELARSRGFSRFDEAYLQLTAPPTLVRNPNARPAV